MDSKAIKVFKCRSCGTYNEIKNELVAHSRRLPEGLESFLIELTVDLLKKDPANLNEMNNYALDYFNHKLVANKPLTNQVIPSNLIF